MRESQQEREAREAAEILTLIDRVNRQRDREWARAFGLPDHDFTTVERFGPNATDELRDVMGA